MNQVYAPGCAVMLYKPELADKMHAFLNSELGNIPKSLTCCWREPKLESGTQIVNLCPGCDRRYRQDYPGITTTSLWEILAGSKTFPFPDYQGHQMTIHDACPTRTEERVHNAVRTLLAKMNIKVVEPELSRTKAVCCGDSFFGVLPVSQVKDQMRTRALQMPCADVAVYCVSCIKSLYIGGKKPRYLLDLLFGEATHPGTYEPDQWHEALLEYISNH